MAYFRPTSTSTPSSNIGSKHNDNEVVESLNDLWNKIRQMFAEPNVDKNEQKIDSIEQKLTDLKLDFEAEMNDVSDDVSTSRKDLEQRLQRLEKLNELVIIGIPYSTGENLSLIFQKISSVLAYTNMPNVYLKRLSKSPIKPGSSTTPILCQFALRGFRDEFYGRYLRHRSLTQSHIGFSNTNRVYINESLTAQDREIRIQAIMLKHQGRIQQVNTRNGVVYVRVNDGDEAKPFLTLKQLFESVN